MSNTAKEFANTGNNIVVLNSYLSAKVVKCVSDKRNLNAGINSYRILKSYPSKVSVRAAKREE